MTTIFEMLKAANRKAEVSVKEASKRTNKAKENKRNYDPTKNMEKHRYLAALHLQGKSECSKCKKIMSLDSFGTSKKRSGYQSACRQCLRDQKRKKGETELIKRRDYLKSLREKGFSECGKCKVVKSVTSFFSLHKGNLVGSRCKECENERKRKKRSTIHLQLVYLKELFTQGKSKCSKCRKVMNLDMFYMINKNQCRKVSSRCIECQKIEGKKLREQKKLKKLEV
jgi:hypothetical protein